MSKFANIPIESIIVNREARQRREITGIDELAASIARNGLINPIVVSDDNVLIAGERRLTACKQLGWTHVTVQFFADLSNDEREVIELEENVRRAELTWQDECKAIFRYHDTRARKDKTWTREATADALGFNITHVNKNILVAPMLRLAHIAQADKFSVAYGIVSRERERMQSSNLEQVDKVFNAPEIQIKLGDAPTLAAPKKVPPLINTNFITWSAEYTGPKFNMLHCDFPYGIGLHASGQAATSAFQTYDDSADIYIELLDTLADRMSTLIAESAHMIFWFPMENYIYTLDRLTAMGWHVQRTPLVWFKSDNTGILPDPRRQPRRIYETAFFCSRGDRMLATGPHGQGAVANAFAAPGGTKTVHMNEKPVEMLRHFMRLCVDEYSIFLDPTAGSGNACRAAEMLGAAQVLGLELSKELFEHAVAAYYK